MPGVLHDDEIPIDSGVVRALVARAMPQCVGLSVRRLPSSGSSNALFRLGEDLLVRLPRQRGGSAAIEKEAKWLPVIGPLLPVAVPEVVGVFAPYHDYPEHWSVLRWIDGDHPEVVDPETPVDPRREGLAVIWPRSSRLCGRQKYPTRQSTTQTFGGTGASHSPRWMPRREETSSVAEHWATSSSISTPPNDGATHAFAPPSVAAELPRLRMQPSARRNIPALDRRAGSPVATID